MVMTRTQIQRMELDEQFRHNKETERAQMLNNAINAAGTVASFMSGAGSIARGVGSLRGAKGATKTITNRIVHEHYHAGGHR